MHAIAFQNIPRQTGPSKPTAIPSLRQLPQDTIQFQGQSALHKKYGIDPNKLTVRPSGTQLPVSKRVLLTKLLEAHEHALKNQALGNFSNRYFSTHMLFTDGRWALGTNMELSRDDNLLCGERSAIINGWNQWLQKIPLSSLLKQQATTPTQARLLVMSGAGPITDPVFGSPCSECQSWLSSQKYIHPDTQIVVLRQDPQTQKSYLWVRPMKDLLPLLPEHQPSQTGAPIEQLTLQISEKAQAVLKHQKIDPLHMRQLIRSAQEAYTQNQTAFLSGKNTAAAVLLSDGQGQKILPGQRLDWTARWYLPPDLLAAAKGIQTNPNSKIQAVAYYGDEPVPNIKNLGILAQQTWGSPDTLIVTVQNQTLQVRTIRDYMSDIYLSSSSHKKA